MNDPSRRRFLKTTSAAALGAVGASSLVGCTSEAAERSLPEIQEGATILFQGDSITDSGRDRNNTDPNSPGALGHGYAFLAAAELLGSYPEKQLQCYNRGISGNKVFQLADRWERDCLSLEPDVLSILIGVNDFWHTLSSGYEGTVETYESDLRDLLDRTLEVLPNVQLILGEPYVLPKGSAITDEWFPAIRRYQEAARQIAADYEAAFIPYQSIYDEASESVPQTYWSGDGVHPSLAGCELMAQAWMETFMAA